MSKLIIPAVLTLMLFAGSGCGKDDATVTPPSRYSATPEWKKLGNIEYGVVPGPEPDTVTLIVSQGEWEFPAGFSLWGDAILINTDHGIQTAIGPCKIVDSQWSGKVVGRGMINLSPDRMLDIRHCEFLQVTPAG